MREAQDSAEKLTHNALQRSAEIEKAIHELKLQRTNFRLQLQKMIELFQQVLDFDRDEDDKDRPLSYLTRKAKKEEGAVTRASGSSPRAEPSSRTARPIARDLASLETVSQDDMPSLEIRNIAASRRRSARRAAGPQQGEIRRIARRGGPRRERPARLRRHARADYAREYAGRPADVIDRRLRPRGHPGPRRRAHAPGLAGRPRPRDRAAARRRELRDDRRRGRRHQRHRPRDARGFGRGAARGRRAPARDDARPRHDDRRGEVGLRPHRRRTRSARSRSSADLARGRGAAAPRADAPGRARDPSRVPRRPRRVGPRSSPTRSCPAVAREGLARFCDVFCDEGVFTVEESRTHPRGGAPGGPGPAGPRRRARALGRRHARRRAARRLGRPPALHRRRRRSPRSPRAGTVAVVLPGTAWWMRSRRAPARELIDAGVPVAVASDSNPGTCCTESLAGRRRPRLPRLGPLGRGNPDRDDAERRGLARPGGGDRARSSPGSRPIS